MVLEDSWLVVTVLRSFELDTLHVLDTCFRATNYQNTFERIISPPTHSSVWAMQIYMTCWPKGSFLRRLPSGQCHHFRTFLRPTRFSARVWGLIVSISKLWRVFIIIKHFATRNYMFTPGSPIMSTRERTGRVVPISSPTWWDHHFWHLSNIEITALPARWSSS